MAAMTVGWWVSP
jgi:hypothetical protein